jgi:hypothetical protein
MPPPSEPPSHAEHGARIVGQLLKSWPAKEAPLSAHIACCEELRLAIAPYAASEHQGSWWFEQLDQALDDNLKALRRQAARAQREADRTKTQLEDMGRQAPGALGSVLLEAWQ